MISSAQEEEFTGIHKENGLVGVEHNTYSGKGGLS